MLGAGLPPSSPAPNRAAATHGTRLSRPLRDVSHVQEGCPPAHGGYHGMMFLLCPLPKGQSTRKLLAVGLSSLGDALTDPAFPIPRSQGHPAFPWGFSLTRSVTHTSQFIDSTPGSQMNSRLEFQRPAIAEMDRRNPRPEHADAPILSHGEHDDGCCRNRLGL